jgi:hypothetical protein
MAWRVAEALLVLRAEINTLYPERSKLSDGTIGNKAHQSRASDHNPWVIGRNGVGVVTAMDVTHDPAHGLDCSILAETLRSLGKSGDKRVKYVIWNRRISSPVAGWKWRAYTGTNPHDKHLHISTSSDPQFYDSEDRWLPRPKPPEPASPPLHESGCPDMVIGLYQDGRIFVINGDVKRQVSRKEADELKAFGVPERKVSSTLLNRFPTVLPPSSAAALD